MKIKVFALLFVLSATVFATNIEGFYKTIDYKTGHAKSIVRIYKCGNAICGRIVALYDEKGTKIKETLNAPSKIAENTPGSPKIAGLDLFWDMKPNNDEKGYKATDTTHIVERVSNSVKLAGLDVRLNSDKNKDEFSGGKLLNPDSGILYSCVIWPDKNDAKKLYVRGKLGPIGHTMVWEVFDVANLPEDLKHLDVSKWTPKIPKAD